MRPSVWNEDTVADNVLKKTSYQIDLIGRSNIWLVSSFIIVQQILLQIGVMP